MRATVLVFLFTVSATLGAGGSDSSVPVELARFVPRGFTAISTACGDLNLDRLEDCIVVIERIAPETDPDLYAGDDRPLLILTRQKDGSLELARTGTHAVLCRACGGIFGDPFQEVRIEPGRFTIEHYGGSSWRWTQSYTFAWSRRDRTWQLVRAEETSVHLGDPDSGARQVHKPPKDFGKIDIADFDPSAYLGAGPK
jgi:hypothetical protein